MTPKSPKEVCEELGDGGQTTVAGWIGVGRSTVHYWVHYKDRFPAEACRAIEEGSEGRFPRHVLRPDVFEPPAN